MFSPSLTHTFVLRPDGLDLIVARAHAPEPVAYERQPLPTGAYGPTTVGDLSPFELTDAAALGLAVRQAIARSGRKTRRARLALDGALVRQLHLPLGYVPSDDELATLVQTEAERYAVFANAEVAVDFVVLRHDGETLSLLFAAFRKDALEAIVDVFASEGVALDGIEPVACATLRHVMSEHPDMFTPEAGAIGVVAVGPLQTDVTTWANAELTSWRSIYWPASALHAGEPEALREAQLDLQRTAAEMPVGRWLLVHVPRALEGALDPMGHADLARHRLGLALEPRDVARGAAGFRPDGPPFAFDMMPRRSAGGRRLSNTQLVGLMAAAGILTAGLAASTVLDGRLRGLRAEIAAIETETAAIQSALVTPDATGSADEAVQAGLRRSASAARAFAMLRDVTPADVWMTTTDLAPGKQLHIEGYSLSRSSPIAFARALGELAAFSNVTMPSMRQDQVEGQAVYRFDIVADVPTEATP